MGLFNPQIQDTNAATAQTQNVNTTDTGAQHTTSDTNASNAGAQSQQNTYTPFQQDLQNEAAKQAGQFLQTGVAPGMDQNLAAQEAAFKQNFNQTVAPQLAAQFGAGSPAIASAESQGLVNLTANAFQNQGSNFNNALGTAGNLAFTATGQNAQNKSNAATNTNTNQGWQDNMNQALDMLANTNYLGLSYSQ